MTLPTAAPTEVELAQYNVVAARRLQWDNLVWQVPVLSLTAQAFLVGIVLGVGSGPFSRVVSALLSIVIAVLSITLMARHRQAELADAHWMRDFEAEFGMRAITGEPWKAIRDAEQPGSGWTSRIPLRPAYPVWIAGLLGFAAVDVLAIVLTFAWPAGLA